MNKDKIEELEKKGNVINLKEKADDNGPYLQYKYENSKWEKLDGDFFNKISDDKRDVKLVLYYLFKNENLKLYDKDKKIDTDKEIIIKYGKTVPIAFGECKKDKKVLSINGFIYKINPKGKEYEFSKSDTLEGIAKLEKSETEVDKLLEVYFNHIMKQAIYHKHSNMSGKFSAMITYECLKKYLDEEFKDSDIRLSAPNCFIKDYNQEFDALIVKKDEHKRNKYFYGREDVLAVLELKTSGVMYTEGQDGENFKKEFERAVIYNYFRNKIYSEDYKDYNYQGKNEHGNEEDEQKKFRKWVRGLFSDKKFKEFKEEIIEKNKDKFINMPPFLYISFHENSKRVKYTEEAIKDYNDYVTKKKKKLPKFDSFFITEKKNSEVYICDYKETSFKDKIEGIVGEKNN